MTAKARSPRTVRTVTESDITPETTIAPVTDIAPVSDIVVEYVDENDSDITLEALIAAQNAQKAQFRPSPNKGDLVAEIFPGGKIGNTAVVSTKPDTGAKFVQITWDRSGLSQLYPIAKIEKFGENAWIARI